MVILKSQKSWFRQTNCVNLYFIACVMSVDKFNKLIRDIEASHPEFFKERRIFSYYELNQDRNTENYILSFFENRPLPKNIEDEILGAYDVSFPPR